MYQAMTARGKPPKVALTAIMRKLIILANALVILPEINRLENWTSPALIIDGDENEEIEIYRAADPGDPEAGRERRACA
jgi:hypothetical protein